jgi:folate-binding protein YgfZ
MPTWHDFIVRQVNRDVVAEYRALDAGPALVDRSDRALLEVTGKDRVTWLHNLATNQVKTLGVGEGNYAFVLNVQGRILLDVNVLVRSDSIWLDLDRGLLDTARKHFTKYTITEDVTVTDRSDEFVRLALAGRAALEVLSSLGASNVGAMAQLSQSTIASPLHKGGQRGVLGGDHASESTIAILRHDFCGPFAVELFVLADRAVEMWTLLTDRHHAIPVGDQAVHIRRIEAGIPWPGHEITSEYLPAETCQLDRAVSYQKGCYLGQEVVERMRSRHVVARQLVGLRLEKNAMDQYPDCGGAGLNAGSPLGTTDQSTIDNRQSTIGAAVLDSDRKPVGTVTSQCHSIGQNLPIALAYVKTALSPPGTNVTVAGARATVATLPFRQ